LFGYCSTVCNAEGTSSPGTRGQAGARSVVTSAGTVPARSALVRKRRAARHHSARGLAGHRAKCHRRDRIQPALIDAGGLDAERRLEQRDAR
jgi:hypothetical protein